MAGFACPDLTTFCRLDELGPVVTGQQLEPDRAFLACRVVAPEVATVMAPFHTARSADEALDECRRRVQQTIHGHRDRKGDPLYNCCLTLRTGADLLTDKQCARLDALFADDAHVEVQATWGSTSA